MWWPGTELNRRRQPFQGCALPPELPGHVPRTAAVGLRGLSTSAALVGGPATGKSRKVCGTLSIITTGSLSLNVAVDPNAACRRRPRRFCVRPMQEPGKTATPKSLSRFAGNLCTARQRQLSQTSAQESESTLTTARASFFSGSMLTQDG